MRSFVLVLLSRLLGVVQDNYTKHDWTAEEIESGMTIQGHRFFDRHGWNEELRTRDLSFPLTQAQAAQLVHATVNEGTPDESERIVTEVEEREFGWVVHWTSRLWWETRDFQHAIAGNVPYYVTRKDGRLVQLGTVGNDEIIAVLERQLAADDEEDHEA